ncbi:hypothetical protein DV737_g3353, partial [Chaetothyriales sp. CBS 132003]
MQSDGYSVRPAAQRGPIHQSPPGSVANSRVLFSSPSQDLRHQVMAQSDYLNGLQMQTRAQYQLKAEESRLKESFRLRLEALFQTTLTEKYAGINPSEIRLKCYGSLNNGFGLANCDMDLLLALPRGFTLSGPPPGPESRELDDDAARSQTSAPSRPDVPSPGATETRTNHQKMPATFELGWLLEDALLDVEIGARLLTKTRVPIMKVCENPDSQLLHSLRECSRESRRALASSAAEHDTSAAPYPPVLDMAAVQAALSHIEDSSAAAQVSIPDSPKRPATTNLEFSHEHGIKCDVNFSNFVALVNTRLLREYCAYDPRVAEVGVFVKTWAKLRDINTPYWGTLSSYGYVLMVLHYLMNVVNPPVIPNLQALAVDDDAWLPTSSVDLFEGKYDIRFWTDKDKIANFKSTAPRNRESAGHLIRGFFWYYSAREGFNYKYDVISLRTRGGLIKKQAKGWTESRWAEGSRSVRQRYLLAIEDPFETEHNVARVVGHNGLCAIRDEFRRAWDIISTIGGPSQSPESDLLEPVENRGDMLRKDQDFHRQKMRDRREAEAKERELSTASLPEGFDVQHNGMFCEDESSITPESSQRASRRRPSNQLLTRAVGNFQDQQPNQIKRGRYRVKDDTDDESDACNEAATGKEPDSAMGSNPASEQAKITADGESQRRQDSTRQGDNDPLPFCDPGEILASNGRDAQGRLVAWDISTQDGRWLNWRDNKIRTGQWQGVVVPDLVLVDKMCPYDPRRPLPKSFFGTRARGLVNYALRPPVPMINDGAAVAPRETTFSTTARKARLPLNRTRPAAPLSADSQPGRRHSSSGQQVGLPIPWDNCTRGGRWLRRRDAYIRFGVFKPPHNLAFAQLHERFPYDPTMTQSQLDGYNQDLRSFYKYRIEPVNDEDRADRLGELPPSDNGTPPSSQSVCSHPSRIFHDVYNHHGVPKNSAASANVYESHQPQHLPFPLSSNPPRSLDARQAGTEDVPDPAFIRSSRLAFFARKELDDKNVKQGDNDDQNISPDSKNIEKLMEEAGITFQPSALRHSNSASRAISAIAGETGSLHMEDQCPGQRPSGSRPQTKKAGILESPPMDDHTSLTDSLEAAAAASTSPEESPQTTNPTSAEPPQEEETTEMQVHNEPEAPGKLDPAPNSHDRPNAVPIPFQFDARQLRDLAVIKEGGNACAREGFQFEIEHGFELGASGDMASRQSRAKRRGLSVPSKQGYDIDLLARVLARSIFHPAIVLIFYLCIAAMHKHRQPLAFYTLYWAALLAAVDVLVWLNHRLTHGPPRPVNWDNEVVVITGGASGLGRVLADSLVRRGVKVAILDVQAADGEAAELMESGDLVWEVCDVAQRDQVGRCVDAVVERLGRPTILVNNAAAMIDARPLLPFASSSSPSSSPSSSSSSSLSSPSSSPLRGHEGSNDDKHDPSPPPPELAPEQASKTFQVNTLGHFNLLHACLPHLLHSATATGTGAHVVTISSVLAQLAPASLADYAASKAAASAIHHSLVHELASSSSPKNLMKTVLVETGQLDTALFANVTHLPWYANFFAPVLDAKDVADAIIGVVSRGESGVVRMPLYASVAGAGCPVEDEFEQAGVSDLEIA